jgi:hypothetical protein
MVSQSNPRFNALKFIMKVHSVRILVVLGRGIKNKGTPFSIMAQIKRRVVEVQAAENYLAYAIIIAKANTEKDPDCEAYRKGRKTRSVVKKMLAKTSVDLPGCVRIPEIIKFQKHFRDCKVIVYKGLACKDIMFEMQVYSPKRFNLLYDDIVWHYHVIVNITHAMAKKCLCSAFTKHAVLTSYITVTRHVVTVRL